LHLSLPNTGTPDFIVWTGDNIAHDIHKSAEQSAEATLQITEYIKEHYPSTIVFPIHGNHEFAPMNLQDLTMEDRETRKVLDLIADAWEDWLTPDVDEHLRERSFYQMKAKDHPKATENF